MLELNSVTGNFLNSARTVMGSNIDLHQKIGLLRFNVIQVELDLARVSDSPGKKLFTQKLARLKRKLDDNVLADFLDEFSFEN